MENRHYLVVGGSHGIGLSLVQRLVKQGAAVTVLSRTWDAETVPPELLQHDQVNHVEGDVTADDLPTDMFPETIHGLAYCPGSISLGPIRQLKPEVMMDDFQLNVVGAVRCLQAALPALKHAESASLVTFSTVAVSQGMLMHASVAAAKGAIEGLTRSLAAELAPAIRANCIAPALTDTPLSARFLSSDQKREAMAKKYPLGRIGRADDIAAIAQFLLSDDSSWITGQVIGIDGGMSAIHG